MVSARRLVRSRGTRRLDPPRSLLDELRGMGPAFVKLGQRLALCPDVVPAASQDALLLLPDYEKPLPWTMVEKVLTEELGPLADRGLTVSPTPDVARLNTQVHKGRLADGTEVTVKVVRPGAVQRLDRALGNASAVARALGRLDGLAAATEELVTGLLRAIRDELDMEGELSNLGRLHAASAGRRLLLAPQPVTELCGKSFLTASYLPGVPVSELVSGLSAPYGAGTARDGALDKGASAEALVAGVMFDALSQGFAIPNIHPSNLIAGPDGRISCWDYGSRLEVPRTIRLDQTRLLSAVFRLDVEEMFEGLTRLFAQSRTGDVIGFKINSGATTRRAISEIGADPAESGPRDGRSPMRDWIAETFTIARTYGFELAEPALGLYRTLAVAEDVAARFGGDAELEPVQRRVVSLAQARLEVAGLDPENLQPVMYSLLDLLRKSPGQINQLLSELTDGRFTLNVSVTEGRKAVLAEHQRSRLIGASLVAVSLALLLTIPDLPKVDGISVGWGLGALLAVVYIRIFTLARRLKRMK